MVDFDELLKEDRKQREIDEKRGYRERTVFVYRCPECGSLEEYSFKSVDFRCDNHVFIRPRLKFVEERVVKIQIKSYRDGWGGD